MKKYIELLRVKHYLKNVLVFIPLFFGGHLLFFEEILNGLVGFISFCFISSAIYIVNDICDAEKDRRHPIKRERPIASGKVSKKTAWIVFAVCLISGLLLTAVFQDGVSSFILLVIYFLLNIGYSIALKNIPILDVFILASGYIIRIMFGGEITGIQVSSWLYLTAISASLYMGLGKRRNELAKKENIKGETRTVLKYYNVEFLSKMMNTFFTLTIAFYSLWSIIGNENKFVFWTIPILILVMMKYSLNIEKENAEGDPISIILNDKILIALGFIFSLSLVLILYFL